MCLIPKFIKDPQTEISQVVLLLNGLMTPTAMMSLDTRVLLLSMARV